MGVDDESFSPLQLYYLAGISHRVADGQGGDVRAAAGGRLHYRHLPSPPFPSFIISLILFFLGPSIAHASLSASPVILRAPSPYLHLRLPEGFHLISPLTEM